MAQRPRFKLFPAALLSAALAAPSLAQTQPGVDLPARALQKADGLAARGQFDLARQEYDDFLKQFPNDQGVTRAKFGRALCAYNLNDNPAAVRDFIEVIGDKTFPKRDEALSLLSSVYLATNDPESALNSLNLLFKDHPSSPQIEGAMVNRAQALYRLGRYLDSLGEASALLKVFPNSPHRAAALYIGALDRRSMGNDAEAETLAREVVLKYPNAPYFWDAQILVGEALAAQNKFTDAITHFKTIDADAPAAKKSAVAFGLAMALARAGRVDDSRRTFDSLIEKYPDSPYVGQAKLQSAVLLIKSGERDRARTALALVSEKYANLAPSAAYWLARCDILELKYESAQPILERLAARKPAPAEISEVAFDLAYCDVALGKDQSVIKRLDAFRTAYPFSPHIPEALYYQANSYHRLGDFTKSFALCEAAIKLADPAMTRPATILKAENMLMLKQYSEADALFATLEKDAKENPEKIRITLRRGQASYYAGDFKTAEERLSPISTALTEDPLQQEAVFLLADAQLQQSHFTLAIKTFQLYLTAGKPHSEEALFKLAISQLGAKDRKAGLATLAELTKLDIKSIWVQRGWFETGQLAYEDRNHEAAAAAMTRILKANPEESIAAPAMYLAARIDLESGKPEAAAKRLTDLIAQYPKHPLAEDASFTIGLSLKEAGKPKEAVTAFDAYIAAYPKGKFVTEAWHQGAASLTASGKSGDAIKILAQLAGNKETRSDTVLYDLAWAQRAAGDLPTATATYEALLKEFPASARQNATRVELAELYSQAGKDADAVTLLDTALKSPTTDARSRAVALYRLGASQFRLGEAEKAAAAFDLFVAENPTDPLMPSALGEAGAAYARAANTKLALERLNKVITDFPKTDPAKLAVIRMGDLQNSTEKYDAAADTFTAWLKAHPGDPLTPLAEFGIGWSLESRAFYDLAREHYSKVIGLDKGATAARAQFQIGETHFKQKNYKTAATELLTVDILYHNPEWAAPALYEAGCAFAAMDDKERAKAQWQDCIKKYPKSTFAALAKKKLEG